MIKLRKIWALITHIIQKSPDFETIRTRKISSQEALFLGLNISVAMLPCSPLFAMGGRGIPGWAWHYKKLNLAFSIKLLLQHTIVQTCKALKKRVPFISDWHYVNELVAKLENNKVRSGRIKCADKKMCSKPYVQIYQLLIFHY